MGKSEAKQIRLQLVVGWGRVWQPFRPELEPAGQCCLNLAQ